MRPELSIIIVNWNGGDLLRHCLESIVRSPPSVTYDIIVVDNVSTDDSLKWLRSDEAKELLGETKLHLIENSENVGFSRANNQGFAESEASMLFLLNPDTEVLPGAIDTLIATLKSSARTGACGPRLLNTDGSLQHSVWRNPPTPWETIISVSGLWRLIPKRVRGRLLLGGHWDHARRRSVPMLSGAAILAKREVIDEVGGLDERFHMYGEDYEWCLRIRRAGWQLIFEPSASVTHHGGQSSRLRWDRQGVQRAQLDSYFQFQRYALSRSHNIANLVAGCTVLTFHRTWKKMRGRPTAEVDIILESYRADLKRMLRES
jgi:GT2 family glycosyltransferase